MIATVLLIMMAIVAGILVTSFSQKSTNVVSDKIIEIGTSIECTDIKLSLNVEGVDASAKLVILNRGSLGIDKVVLRKFFENDVETRDIDTFTDGVSKLLPGKGDDGGLIRFEYDLCPILKIKRPNTI